MGRVHVTHGSYILPLQKNLIVSHFTRNLTEINDISNKETPTYEAWARPIVYSLLRKRKSKENVPAEQPGVLNSSGLSVQVCFASPGVQDKSFFYFEI